MNDKTSNGRKKLSLCTPRKTQKRQTIQKESLTKQPQQKALIGTRSDELNWLYKQKERLNKQIQQIERRLIFGFSEPLQNYCYELKHKDMLISCKITDLLIDALNQARG
ncbi:hypothetical protein L3V79_07030 [Thiotrichales bacterium 19S9-12]|nr:hypothetical protein [Thiotrichales bacterium 19S9-11]MCF6812107.1 hypothetical protein [Thiotrichales bacterium 19S9-12]